MIAVPFRYDGQVGRRTDGRPLKTLLKIRFLSRALCHCWRAGQVLKDVNQCQAIEKRRRRSGLSGGWEKEGATKPKSQERERERESAIERGRS